MKGTGDKAKIVNKAYHVKTSTHRARKMNVKSTFMGEKRWVARTPTS